MHIFITLLLCHFYLPNAQGLRHLGTQGLFADTHLFENGAILLNIQSILIEQIFKDQAAGAENDAVAVQ